MEVVNKKEKHADIKKGAVVENQREKSKSIACTLLGGKGKL